MTRPEYGRVSQAEDSGHQYELESGANSEDESVPRTSEDVRRHDDNTLTAEEEAERLLAGGGEKPASSRRSYGRSGGSRRSRGGTGAEKRELMYDTEEGGLLMSSAESSGHSSEVDMARLGETQHTRKRSKRRRFCGFAAVHVIIVLAFLALLFGAWKASLTSKKTDNGEKTDTEAHADPSLDSEVAQHDEKPAATTYKPQTLSNGTHLFAPTTLLISLDGFRADFLQRHITPVLTSFAESGVSPAYMYPSFPSLTFPNHFTLVTGLHPESHGIVGNTFFDPELKKEFYYTDPARSMQDYWWDAEPLWVTAEKQGVRTGVHMWPGSEVEGGIAGVEASYVDSYNGDEHLDNKVKRVLGWLDLLSALDGSGKDGKRAQQELRPQFIAAYVPDVDADGHLYGPNSTYIRSTITEVDGMLGSLFRGIEERNLTEILNIVIVSDHGMATTSYKRLIQLEDLIDTSLIEHTDGWPLYGLRPYDTSEANVQKLYEQLRKKSQNERYKHAFDVYLRDSTMPKRYHFANNPRIAPLWLVPKTGWAIVTKDEFDVAAGLRGETTYHPRGLHGYDNQHPLMRAIFVARGPAFPHTPGSRVEAFQNTEVYNIICDSLGIEPVANNGSLRLPLKTLGTHNFDDPVEVPEDPQDDESLALPPPTVPNLASPHAGDFSTLPIAQTVPSLANRPDFMVPTADVPPVSPAPSTSLTQPTEADHPTRPSQIGQPNRPVDGEDAVPTRPVVHDGLADDEKDNVNRWWSWVTGKIEAIKGWAIGVFGAENKGDKDAANATVTR